MQWYLDRIETERTFPFQSNLPLNVSDRATQLAQTMMNGNVDKSINDWYNDLKDEQTYNDMVSHPTSYHSQSIFQIGNTNESGPVETFVGCSKVDIIDGSFRSNHPLRMPLVRFVLVQSPISILPSTVTYSIRPCTITQ